MSNNSCQENIENMIENPEIVEQIKPIKKRTIVKQPPLNKYFSEDNTIIEIGVDEVGRGPMFGRVYTAAVILPKDDSFNHSLMKDSKKFHSKKKIEETAVYIKQNCVAWHVSYEDEKTIDSINILQATQKSMHSSILTVKQKYLDMLSNTQLSSKFQLLIDGNYFNPITFLNKQRGIIETMPHICVEGGDNKYTSIAAASILAKVARDEYIEQMCNQYPELSEKYGIDSNKGYGSKQHMDGIKQHGITIWHRRSFGICKEYV
jgi:ribonuclease HII